MSLIKNNGLLYPLLKGLFGLSASETYLITSKASEVVEIKAFPTQTRVRVLAIDGRTTYFDSLPTTQWWSYTKSWNSVKDDFYQELLSLKLEYVIAEESERRGQLLDLRRFLDALYQTLDLHSTTSEIVVTITNNQMHFSTDAQKTKVTINLKG